ncbi:Ldh family oxidoreductase [Faunimonas sp. B44]|uniref:Ldh family oxidoreductase n=1 Tax=Faunimonas sp. B44 TaxID=3461493 RepID=UPI004044C562
MSDIPRVAVDRCEDLVSCLLESAGASRANARMVAVNLVEAETLGRVSHGMRLVPTYITRLLAGEVSGTAVPEVICDRGAMTTVTGNKGFGQIVGEFAAEIGVLRAREHGVAIVAVRQSGHLGRNGRWAEIAARAGIASIHFGHSFGRYDLVVPFGGTAPTMRSSPIAFGAPFEGGDVVLDFSVAEMSANAVKHAAERGARLPTNAVMGADGVPTDDPAVFAAGLGGILPFGGFKGYGIAVFAELFAGILASGGPGEPRENASFGIYLDVRQLRDWEAYQAEVAQLLDHIRSSPAAAGSSGIFIPGERGRRERADRLAKGIPLTTALQTGLVKAAHMAGVEETARARWPTVFRNAPP